MWMSFAMDENKQKGIWLAIKRKAFKWAKVNVAPPKDHLDEFPW
jgi:hypothetical protein